MNVNEPIHLVLNVQQQPDHQHPPAGESPNANVVCKCSTQLPTRTYQTCQKLPLHLLESSR